MKELPMEMKNLLNLTPEQTCDLLLRDMSGYLREAVRVQGAEEVQLHLSPNMALKLADLLDLGVQSQDSSS